MDGGGSWRVGCRQQAKTSVSIDPKDSRLIVRKRRAIQPKTTTNRKCSRAMLLSWWHKSSFFWHALCTQTDIGIFKIASCASSSILQYNDDEQSKL